MKTKKDKSPGAEQPLKIETNNGVLTISIGVNVFCEGAMRSPTGVAYKIYDFPKFVKEAIYEMQREEEDGATILSDMLDLAANNAVDNGAEGVDYDAENGPEDY